MRTSCLSRTSCAKLVVDSSTFWLPARSAWDMFGALQEKGRSLRPCTYLLNRVSQRQQRTGSARATSIASVHVLVCIFEAFLPSAAAQITSRSITAILQGCALPKFAMSTNSCLVPKVRVLVFCAFGGGSGQGSCWHPMTSCLEPKTG